MRTMPVVTQRRTRRGHCEFCGGEIKERRDVAPLTYQCQDCGCWQDREVPDAQLNHDHTAVKVGRERKASGQPSHRQRRRGVVGMVV